MARSTPILILVAPEDISPGQSSDIGTPAVVGGTRFEGDCLFSLAGERGFSGTSDEFHFVYQRLQGDFRVTLEITDWQTEAGGKVALMMRENLAPGARYAGVTLSLDRAAFRHRFRRREQIDAVPRRTSHGTYTQPQLSLDLQRMGDTVTGRLTDGDGVTWTEPDVVVLDGLSAEVYVGFGAHGSVSPAEPSVVTVCPLSVESFGPEILPGDCNEDGALDISDGVCLLGHLFQGNPEQLPCGDGSVSDPANTTLLDSNGDGSLDLSDPVRLFRFLFGGALPPTLGIECVTINTCSHRCVR